MRTMSGDPCLHYDCLNRNSFGYCKTTACINPKYSNIGTAQYGQGVQKRIATNATRIRAMTDEEMANEFSGQCPAVFGGTRMSGEDYAGFESCQECWLDWLKEEADI